MPGRERRGDCVFQGDDNNAVQWAFHFDSRNEGEPGMVKGWCAASGAIEVTIIARAASTRPGQGAEVGAGSAWLYKMPD